MTLTNGSKGSRAILLRPLPAAESLDRPRLIVHRQWKSIRADRHRPVPRDQEQPCPRLARPGIVTPPAAMRRMVHWRARIDLNIRQQRERKIPAQTFFRLQIFETRGRADGHNFNAGVMNGVKAGNQRLQPRILIRAQLCIEENEHHPLPAQKPLEFHDVPMVVRDLKAGSQDPRNGALKRGGLSPVSQLALTENDQSQYYQARRKQQP